MGGMPGTGGSGGAPSDGGQPTACSNFAVGSALTLAPAAAGQAYVRCGSLGPEQNWDVTPSPAGDRLAARTAAGTVRLLSTSTWAELAQLASPVGEMDALAFSPDGSLLATLSSEAGQVTLWRARDGAYQTSFAGPPASTVDTFVSSLAFSSDGHRLATSLGTVIDLTTGQRTSWQTGAPDTTTLETNPENLGINGGGVAQIRFTAGDARLFIVTRYEIGDSPYSIRLELRDPATGAQTVLFDMYDRALLGYAISDDGRYIALDGSPEAVGSSGLYHAGLYVVDATSGTQVAADPNASSTQVLGFGHDGARLFTDSGGTVTAVGTTNLQPLSSFTAPSGVSFIGVTPQDALVGTDGSTTTAIYQSATGAVLQSFPFPSTSVRFTSNGRFAVANGDPRALFHFWRQADAVTLCGPPAGTGSAPSIASLGTVVVTNFNPGSTQTMSADGSVTATAAFLIHDHVRNFYDIALSDTASGSLLRQFGAFDEQQLSGPMALSVPTGDKVYTPVFTPLKPPGPDVAVWCR